MAALQMHTIFWDDNIWGAATRCDLQGTNAIKKECTDRQIDRKLLLMLTYCYEHESDALVQLSQRESNQLYVVQQLTKTVCQIFSRMRQYRRLLCLASWPIATPCSLTVGVVSSMYLAKPYTYRFRHNISQHELLI